MAETHLSAGGRCAQTDQTPKIVLLKENNAPQEFFERHEYEVVLRHLPDHLSPVVTFA